jgi:PleD family two-component response regulator
VSRRVCSQQTNPDPIDFQGQFPDIFPELIRETSVLSEKVVLLVDDDSSTLNATRTGLMERGFNVRAVDGAEAAVKAISSLKPSIIVSDLVMPGTNGFELFQQVQQLSEFKSIPFIFLTGIDDYYAKKFGKEIGGAAYVTKPVDLDELEQLLKEKLGESSNR